MAWEDVGNIIPMTAAAAIAANTGVKLHTVDNQVTPVTSLTADIPIGVAKAAAASGAGVAVQINGVCRVACGAAVARGVALSFDTTARVIAATTGFACGVSLEAGAAAGSIISVLLEPKTVV